MGTNHQKGPLHLQRNLTVCTETLEKVMRTTVGHSLTCIYSLYCRCGASGKLPVARTEATPADSISARTAQARKRGLESAATMPSVAVPGSSAGLPAVPGSDDDRRNTCRFFAIKLNDEEAVIHAFCRRCENRVLIYDRALYWGTKRGTLPTPETFPYRCTCGSHAFEIAIGFDYPEDAIDENDINTITVTVRCVTCGTDAMIFDDEAT
jgi:hypothetical protein